jgi:hypothetical protein
LRPCARSRSVDQRSSLHRRWWRASHMIWQHSGRP